MTVPQTLFDILDMNQDGELSRSELSMAAEDLGWHWREAPLFALLDWLTVSRPLSKDRFIQTLQQVAQDPMGPYGDVLLSDTGFLKPPKPFAVSFSEPEICQPIGARDNVIDPNVKDAAFLLEYAGPEVSIAHRRLSAPLDLFPLSPENAALLIIDPQRSFTDGVWMRSIGVHAEADVAPIRLAFDRCTRVLKRLYGCMAIMFSRCPFPPGSYDWYGPLSDILDRNQPYVIKPGNSILFPPTNGFRKWIHSCIENGIRSLVIGGCTLNSCVRVSSMEIQSLYPERQLQVLVDVSLCGARGKNYLPAPMFGGDSAATSALTQMAGAGVKVVRQVVWT